MDPTLSIATTLYERIRGKGLGLRVHELNRSECVPSPKPRPVEVASPDPAPESEEPNHTHSAQLQVAVFTSPIKSPYSPSDDAENKPPSPVATIPTSELRRREKCEHTKRQQVRQQEFDRIKELKKTTSEWSTANCFRRALMPSPEPKQPMTKDNSALEESQANEAPADPEDLTRIKPLFVLRVRRRARKT